MKGKYCLKSVASFKDINNSQTNRSRTKQSFSFSKGQRFENIKPLCQKNAYQQLPFQRKNSGISIGRASRSDFTKIMSNSPGVSKYNLKTLFNDSQQVKKGYSLGLSRQKVQFGNYINKQILDHPSPARYDNLKKNKPKSPAYTLRTRTKILDKTRTIQPQNQYPGPADYENPQIKFASSKYISKFSNVSFSAPRSKRFGDSDNKVPGPGIYNDVSNLSNVGKYIVSSHQGGTKAKFDNAKRISKFDQARKNGINRPGPGYYKQPSQFGQYDGDVYQNYQTLNTSRYSKRVTGQRQ